MRLLPALAALGLVLAFGGLIWRALRRRDRSVRPTERPLFTHTCSTMAGIEMVSAPFSRVELWPDALVVTNPNVTVPLASIAAAFEKPCSGGTVLIVEHAQGEASPLELGALDTAGLISLLSSLRVPTPGLRPQGSPSKPA